MPPSSMERAWGVISSPSTARQWDAVFVFVERGGGLYGCVKEMQVSKRWSNRVPISFAVTFPSWLTSKRSKKDLNEDLLLFYCLLEFDQLECLDFFCC